MRTGFGDYPMPFNSGTPVPFQGSGQGNGVSPTIWLAISAVLMHLLAAMGFGMTIMMAISTLAISATCFAFVDDTDLVHAAPDN